VQVAAYTFGSEVDGDENDCSDVLRDRAKGAMLCHAMPYYEPLAAAEVSGSPVIQGVRCGPGECGAGAR
jgi:hypothetical protein